MAECACGHLHGREEGAGFRRHWPLLGKSRLVSGGQMWTKSKISRVWVLPSVTQGVKELGFGREREREVWVQTPPQRDPPSKAHCQLLCWPRLLS